MTFERRPGCAQTEGLAQTGKYTTDLLHDPPCLWLSEWWRGDNAGSGLGGRRRKKCVL